MSTQSNKHYKVAVLAGDGIGPEVMAEALKVLDAVSQKFGFAVKTQSALVGGAAIDAHGEALPAATLELCKQSDAILFGAIGHAMYDNDPSLKVRPEQGLLKIRKELGLYANLRPILLFDELLQASSIKPTILKGTDISKKEMVAAPRFFSNLTVLSQWNSTLSSSIECGGVTGSAVT